MRIAVLPNGVALPTSPTGGSFDARIALFEPRDTRTTGSVGTGVFQRFNLAIGRTADVLAWDLTALAMGAIAADRHFNRAATSPDGWTRGIGLTLAVSAPALWDRNRSLVERMLGFLTGDVWSVDFVGGGVHPEQPRKVAATRGESCVALLSGGLDSLIGAINMHARGTVPLFVSNRVRGDCEAQRVFASETGALSSFLALNHNARTGTKNPEISQRPRSLAFIAFGVLTATALDRYQGGSSVDLHVPENGFISLNVPLSPLRSGSLSTRTTHPIFMADMQHLLDNLGLRVRLLNPYQHKTKGEMMQECADQALLAKLAPTSMSCGKSGRTYCHCGRCLPCLVRRGAFLHWTGSLTGDTAIPHYLFPHPSGAFKQRDFLEHPDVMECLTAIDTATRRGIRAWIGPAVTAGRIASPKPFRDVAERGLDEIRAFMAAAGLV